MIDPEAEEWDEEQRLNYIFEDKTFEDRIRVNWITDCLLGDIRTFLDGIEYFFINKPEKVGKRSGGGNLSVPILINTALEFVAALYAGKTDYIQKDKKPVFNLDRTFESVFGDNQLVSEDLKRIFEEKGYQLSSQAKYKARNSEWKIVDNEEVYPLKRNDILGTLDVLIVNVATLNAKKFIMRYFPEKYKEIPLLLWDGIRNGLVHTFSPKAFEYEGSYIRFQFYVEDQNFPSHIEKAGNTTLIRINVFELFRIFEKAVDAYRAELENSTALQNKFIRAWSSIEDYTRKADSNRSKEGEIIDDYLDSKPSALVLKGLNDVLTTDVLKIYSLGVRRS